MMHPTVSFQHTMREIAVNRENPCELVRELISNSYDAKARNIWLVPLPQFEGLAFWDDGHGLTDTQEDGSSGYVSFFSIGDGTKLFGSQIGYKCQGSKLALAAGSLTVITRCTGEASWRWTRLENPKDTLSSSTDITPHQTTKPWLDVIQKHYKARADDRTNRAMKAFDQAFFEHSFQQGTMIIVDHIEGADYEKLFIVPEGLDASEGYLYQYLRFYTAHGDVRLIDKSQGFSASDVKAVRPVCTVEIKVTLWDSGTPTTVPRGWDYLPCKRDHDDVKPQSPKSVQALKNASFYARFAATFELSQQRFSVILAIDGKRRALTEYRALGRQKASKSGVPLAQQRGVILSAHGVRVTQWNQLLDIDTLREHQSLRTGIDHFALLIDGPFELVTNRNTVAPSAQKLLKSPEFAAKIGGFLDKWRALQSDDGRTLSELEDRLMGEATESDRNNYVEARHQLIESLKTRTQFSVRGVPALANKWFYEPQVAEENFVGVLYALFGYHVPADHELKRWWKHPLTFNSRGIDSIANGQGSYSDLEYKWRFSFSDVYNHAFIVTDLIICWDFDDPKLGVSVTDDLGDIASVTSLVSTASSSVIGVKLGDIRDAHGDNPKQTAIHLLSLKRLIESTFELSYRHPPSRTLANKRRR
jgi:hypothetical protein